jgi:putative tryptophan/tyrosine transport system substrate-binding protein
MKRREFMTLAGVAATLPLTARAQQPGPMRRIGVLMGIEANDAETQPRRAIFEQELERLGWSGRNVHIEYRFAGADLDRMQAYAKELIALPCDIIVGHNTRPVATILQQTRAIPVVFVAVADAVGSGFAASLAKPGGNATGFINHDPAMGGKWLGLLREAVPSLSKAALLYNPETAPVAGSYFKESFDAAARALAMTATPAIVRSPADIEKVLTSLGGEQNYGLVVMPDTFTTVHREKIVGLAAAQRLPAIYPWRYFAVAGGLLVYGVDQLELFRLAAAYVDRILRGENPSNLPVQAPTRFELIINLKTAKALGLEISPSLLARADEVIE